MALPRAAVLLLLLVSSLGLAVPAGAVAPPPLDGARTLMEPIQPPTGATFQATPPPDGAPLPSIQDGIGPGSALQQFATPGNGGFICTAAFLLRDPQTATYYLSTAGHCVVRDENDPNPYTGARNPSKVDQVVRICVAGCIDNALSLGTYVDLVAKDGYQPVTFGQSGGVGDDFGIIRLPDSVHDRLRPWMPQFGGPTGYDPSKAGDLLVHYGHGSYCCPLTGAVASRTPADQGRVAVSLGADGTSFTAIGSSTGGDSGSGVARGTSTPSRGVQGGAAVGVLTHGIVVEGIPYYLGTTLKHGLDMVRANTGLALELVLQDDKLDRAPRPPAPAASAQLSIDEPAPGATVRAGRDGTTEILGSAAMANSSLPAEAAVQVAIDDPGFAPASRLPVLGNSSWQANWDLHGVPTGSHTITLAAGTTTASKAPPHGATGGAGSVTGIDGTGKATQGTRRSSAPVAPLLLALILALSHVARTSRRRA